MIIICGYDKIPEFKAFDPVKEHLEKTTNQEIYLGAFCCKQLGIDLKDKTIYNMEYLHDMSPLWGMGYKEVLLNNKVLDFSRSNVEYLKKIGIAATYYPYTLSEVENQGNQDKDIDVLFIGSTHFDRRLWTLESLKKKCNVTVAKGVYGKDLVKLIKRAKVHLNMHHAEGQPLEVVRINQLLKYSCLVVSEEGSDTLLNNEYKNKVIFSKYEDLVSTCLEALQQYNRSLKNVL